MSDYKRSLYVILDMIMSTISERITNESRNCMLFMNFKIKHDISSCVRGIMKTKVIF